MNCVRSLREPHAPLPKTALFCGLSSHLLLMVIGLCVPGFSPRAQPAAPASATKARYDAAKKLADQGRCDEVIPLLNDLLVAEPHPRTRNLLAACLANEERYGSAYAQFVLSVQECQAASRGPERVLLQSVKKYAEDSIRQLLPLLSWVRLRFPQPPPAGLRVRVGDSELIRSRWADEVPVDAGTIVVTAEAPRVQRIERSLSLRKGEHKEVELVFQHDGAGILYLQPPTIDGAVVKLDDDVIQPEVLTQPHYLSPGPHRVVVEAPGFNRFTWSGSVDDGVEQRLNLLLRPKPTTPRWVCYGSLAGGTAALIIGAAIGGVAQAKANRASMANDESQRVDVIRLSTASTALLAVGGTLLAATIPLGLTSDFLRPARPSAKPLLTLSPSSMRAVWRF